jgi:uncharacterized protein YndB with AHSA1/START domain
LKLEQHMKWVLAVVGVLVAAIGVIVAIGFMLPKAHVASCTARYKQAPEEVWKAITGIGQFPSWRPAVKSVEVLDASATHLRWREHDAHNAITYESVKMQAPETLVTRIADAGLPFGGSWTYQIRAVPGGSELSITEDGEVYNPVFRFVSRFIMGYHGTIETYMKDLGKRFGEETTPERR